MWADRRRAFCCRGGAAIVPNVLQVLPTVVLGCSSVSVRVFPPSHRFPSRPSPRSLTPSHPVASPPALFSATPLHPTPPHRLTLPSHHALPHPAPPTVSDPRTPTLTACLANRRYCHCIYDSKEQASLALEKLNDQVFPGSDSKVAMRAAGALLAK